MIFKRKKVNLCCQVSLLDLLKQEVSAKAQLHIYTRFCIFIHFQEDIV